MNAADMIFFSFENSYTQFQVNPFSWSATAVYDNMLKNRL